MQGSFQNKATEIANDVNQANMQCRPRNAEAFVASDRPIIGQPSLPFQEINPASKLGNAMLHVAIEQLWLLTWHPSFGH